MTPDMKPIFLRVTPGECQARKDRALQSVGLTEDELSSRVVDYSCGEPSPDERDAWHEVDTVNFLLRAGAVGRLTFSPEDSA